MQARSLERSCCAIWLSLANTAYPRDAKQELSAVFTRKIAQQIMDAALASAKYEGDYAHVMATPTPAAKVQIPSASGEEPAADREPTSKAPRESPKN